MNRSTPVQLPEGYVDFFKALETWQNTQEINVKKSSSFSKVDILSIIKSKNRPLLELIDLPVDLTAYRTSFIDLLTFMVDNCPEITDTVHTIKSNIDMYDFNIIPVKLLQDDLTYFKAIAEEIDVPAELLIFSFDHALRPFLRAYAGLYHTELANDEFQSWNFSTICPVCSTKPHISRLRASDGRRFMFCDRCFSEWEAKYLQCVFCGNDEPGSIKYLNIENDNAYQIYTCEKCKGYLKTYDERQTGRSTDLFIANIETVYLDMLAQDKGYSCHDAE